MSGINLSDILGNIEEHFPDVDYLEIEIDDKAFSVEDSLEDAQKEIENKDSIDSLVIRLSEGCCFDYYNRLNWSVEGFEIVIYRKDEKGYSFETEVDILADSEYSDMEDFEDVASEIWDELKKEGYSFAENHDNPFMELNGDYSLGWNYSRNWEYAETITETLKQVYNFLEYLLSAIETMEEYHFRLTEHYEDEDE